MHAEIEEPHGPDLAKQATGAFAAIIGQIIVIDMVFSINSIVTAVGMADHVEVMIAAVIVAVGLMFVASGPIAGFVAEHPTTKMLALAFLLLIGVSLVADGLGFHIEKGYIYAAMGFRCWSRSINIIAKARRVRRAAAAGATKSNKAAAATVPDSVLATAVAGEAPKPQAEIDARITRAQSRPKSAPRKKS